MIFKLKLKILIAPTIILTPFKTRVYSITSNIFMYLKWVQTISTAENTITTIYNPFLLMDIHYKVVPAFWQRIRCRTFKHVKNSHEIFTIICKWYEFKIRVCRQSFRHSSNKIKTTTTNIDDCKNYCFKRKFYINHWNKHFHSIATSNKRFKKIR